VVDGSDIAWEKYCRCSQILVDPTGSRWRPCPDIVGDAVLDALG
jgi:hypothetical protein